MTRSDEILSTFQDIGEMSLRNWRERFPDYRPLGFLSGYVPEELFHAAGFSPVFLLHGREGCGHAQAHLPGFTCWVVRSALDRALSGELSALAGVAFAHTCDAVQALADLWPRVVPNPPALYVAMPHHLAAPAARPYLLAELQRLRERLEQITDRALSDEALRESIALHNRTRALVRQLYEVADRLPAPALHTALQAAFLMPKEVYNPLMADLLDTLEAHAELALAKGEDPKGSPKFLGSQHHHRPRLFVVGPELADPTLYQVIADAGGRVVGDLLDLGQRYFARAVGETGGPLEALAEHTLAMLPTPTKYHPQRRREAHLLDMVSAGEADGVIFARQKFCDPHGFDVVTLKTALDKANVPHLLVELEQTPHIGQMRTRVEAFLEMIGA